MGIYELLTATPEVKQLVRSRATVPQVVVAARAGGMRLLRQDAIEQCCAESSIAPPRGRSQASAAAWMSLTATPA